MRFNRRGIVAVDTLGNTPNADILCRNVSGAIFAHIQLKTFIRGNRTVLVGRIAEIDFGRAFFLVLASIPSPTTESDFTYFIIASKEMEKNVCEAHLKWLSQPGRKGTVRSDSKVRTGTLPTEASNAPWDLMKYRNNCGLNSDLL